MQTAFATDIFYDGSQLRSGFISETFGLSGDAIVAFTGGCDVSPDHMGSRCRSQWPVSGFWRRWCERC